MRHLSVVVALSALLLVACGDEEQPPASANEYGEAAPAAAPPPADPAAEAGNVEDDAEAEVDGEAVPYQCEDMRVMVRFAGDRAVVELPKEKLVLPVSRVASGARYASPEASFWSKGEGAVLTWNEQERKCLRIRAEARQALPPGPGVAISARGNEPGWTVQVAAGESPALTALLDYGQRRVEFDDATRFLDEDESYGVRAGNGERALELRIRDVRCQDSMSGQYFAAYAELLVGEARYFGCATVMDPHAAPDDSGASAPEASTEPSPDEG